MNQKSKAAIRFFLYCVLLIGNLKLLSQKQINYHEVISFCNKEIERTGISNPKSNYFYKVRADSYYSLNNYNEAIKDYKTSIRLGNKSAEVFLNLGICFYDTKKLDSSIIYLKKSLNSDKNNVSANLYLSEYYKANKKYNLAIKQLRAIEKKHSTNYQIKYNLGLLEIEMQEYDKAIKLFNLCYDHNYLKINSLLNRCNCLTQQNQLVEARNCIENAKKIDSTNNFILIYEGNILVRYNKISEACEKYTKSLTSGNQSAKEYIDKYKCK